MSAGPTPDMPRKLSDLEYIPLAKAHLCEDCENIGNHPSQCPACGSNALMNLAAVLSGKRKKEEHAEQLMHMHNLIA